MALKLESVRALAERVAVSHGLVVVDVEYLGGGGKHRTLRVFLEKNEAERASLRERVARLQAEADDAAEPDELEDEDESGAEADEESGAAFDADQEQDAASLVEEQDAAFLAGLPTVANLELLSGITHEDCERFSRDFGTVLDVEELVPGTEYLLEISSPGLDRKLFGPADYERFTGCLAKVELFEAVDGNRKWQGRLAGIHEGRLRLDLPEKAQGRKTKKGEQNAAPKSVEIAASNVERAQLVPEF